MSNNDPSNDPIEAMKVQVNPNVPVTSRVRTGPSQGGPMSKKVADEITNEQGHKIKIAPPTPAATPPSRQATQPPLRETGHYAPPPIAPAPVSSEPLPTPERGPLGFIVKKARVIGFAGSLTTCGEGTEISPRHYGPRWKDVISQFGPGELEPILPPVEQPKPAEPVVESTPE